MDELTARAQQVVDFLQDAEAQVRTRDMMKHREGSHQVENLVDRASTMRLSQSMVVRSARINVAGASSQPCRATSSRGWLKSRPVYGPRCPRRIAFACQFAIPAAQVEQRLVAGQRVQYPLNARLEVLARGRKFPPEGLVELFIQGKQPCDGFGVHNLIISVFRRWLRN